MVRLFRDADADGPSYEAEDIDLYNKYVYWTKEEVECYNAAIDKAIEIVKNELPKFVLTSTGIISKLQALKK